MLKLLLALLLARLFFTLQQSDFCLKPRLRKMFQIPYLDLKKFSGRSDRFFSEQRYQKFFKMGCCGPNEKERADEIEKGGNLNFQQQGFMDGWHKLIFKVLSRVDGSPIFIAVLLLELLLHFGSLLRSLHSEREMLSDLSCLKVRINGS